MTNYTQPSFYRFNEDSLRLVKWILQQGLSPRSILDMGAGCGVIGIELALALGADTLTMVEAQADYSESLETNCQDLLDKTLYQIEYKTFADWIPDKAYDLIVSNPPYYLPGHGEKNADIRREKARSFILDNWTILLQKIAASLEPIRGRAYIVIKDDKRIVKEIERVAISLTKKFHNEGHLKILELSGLNKN